MKTLSTLTLAAALSTIAPAISATAAINCGTLPTCEELGYKDLVSDCPGDVLKCPFDTTKGQCQRGPSVGDLKYSFWNRDHDGWLLCNGKFVEKTKYAKLYNILHESFGGSGDTFRIPDYRGFFLRGAYRTETSEPDPKYPLSNYGGSPNFSVVIPQMEQLPNIRGRFSGVGQRHDTKFPHNPPLKPQNTVEGAFYVWNTENKPTEGARVSNGDSSERDDVFGFDANFSSPIYKDNGHVIPANYASYIFIYAGVK